MSVKFNAKQIASYFVKKGVSPLKLQKLLYYSQLWFFVKNRTKLFGDEIKAWVYGPVVYDVWDTFRYVKRNSIIPQNRLSDIEINDNEVLKHLNQVWNAYGHLSGSELVDLTHQDPPWTTSRKGYLNSQPSSQEVKINSVTTSEFNLDYLGNIPIVEKSNSLGNYTTN